MPSSKKPRQSALAEEQSQVARIMGRAEERFEESQPGAGRGQAGHAGQKGVDKRGQQKATYYYPEHRQELVRQIAESEDVSQGDIIEAAVVAFYNAWRAGKVNLDDLKTGARSLRVSWKLAVPDEFSFFSEDTQH